MTIYVKQVTREKWKWWTGVSAFKEHSSETNNTQPRQRQQL